MSNIIDSIKLSGTVYTLSAQTSGGGNPTVELTQAEYDALVTAGTVSADTYYIITDAEAGDLTNYYTKTETNTLLGGKQATLVSGTNIKTINNESILGSGNIDIQGGGKAVSGGTNISITTGATADTINCTLPMFAGHNNMNSTAIAFNSNKNIGASNHKNGENSLSYGYYGRAYGQNSFAGGNLVSSENSNEFSVGTYNVSNTGSTDADRTLFSVGNGTADNARHNAFEIRQNGDIYLNNGTSDIKLQDYLQIKVVKLTQSAYDALSPNYDSNTLYIIKD